MSNINDQLIQEKIDSIKTQFEKRIEEIKQRGADRINQITEDSPEPNQAELVFDIVFDVKMETKSVKFDVPKFSTEPAKISFSIPTVRMETKTISWDEPATRMVTKCIAKKPEVKCWMDGWKPKCTTEWTCIYADVPEVYMKRREIKIDVPEFTMKIQEIKFDKPVLRLETVEMKFDVPQFYFKKLSVEMEEQKEELEGVGKEMESDIAVAKSRMDQSIVEGVSETITSIYSEIRASLLNERSNVSTHYDDAIAKMKTTVKILKENNAVNEVARMEDELGKMVGDYTRILADIDKSISELQAQQDEALNNVKVKEAA